MGPTLNPRPYTAIDVLQHVYLEDSYVLDVVARPGLVTFSLDVALTPEHELYEKPSTEQHSYRRAKMIFDGVRELVWNYDGYRPARDATGEIDWGNIDSFLVQDGRYSLEGDWGRMELVCENVDFNFDEDQS